MAQQVNADSPTWWGMLKDKFYAFYDGIAQYTPNPFKGLSLYGKAENPDSTKIQALREKHFQLIDQEAAKPQADFNQVTKIITEDTKQYVNQIIMEEQKNLGKAPCEFSVFTLGSMARKESGPITDLEIGFLVKEKNVNTYKYFYQLSQNISDRLFLLGEHPDVGGKGLRMDEADNAPPHRRFFARNLTNSRVKNLVNEAVLNKEWDKMPFEGSRPFLTTPEEFASFSKPDFKQNRDKLFKLKKEVFHKEWVKIQKDPKNLKALKTKAGKAVLREELEHWVDQLYRPYNPRELRTAKDAGTKLGRNIDCLYGNRALYENFFKKREKIFSQKEKNGKTIRKNFAKTKMKEDLQEHIQKGKSIFVTGELGKTLDIKRELYRFGEQFITNLGFYHGCKNQNTIDIVAELCAKKVIEPIVANKLTDYMQFATGLRLKEQRVIKRQGFAAYFDNAEFNEDKEDLEKQIANLKMSIDYMVKSNIDKDGISIKKRDLAKLEAKLEHLLEMAPGKIYSEADIGLLRTKYAPLAKEIFEMAKDWTLGKDHVPTITHAFNQLKISDTNGYTNVARNNYVDPNPFSALMAKYR